MNHELKILPVFFEAVLSGDKTFEIRNTNDRDLKKGDTVVLNEHNPKKSIQSGKRALVEITYVTNYSQPNNQVVFSFKMLNDNLKYRECVVCSKPYQVKKTERIIKRMYCSGACKSKGFRMKRNQQVADMFLEV